jgi:carboxyl-terminal processing protease
VTELIEVPTVAEVEEPPKEIFHTASGREVYGGGGITPDYVVKTPRPSDLWFELNRENLIFDYAVLYVARHAELETGFQIDDATLQDFQRFLNEKDFEYSVGDFEQARDELALRLRAHIARIK